MNSDLRQRHRTDQLLAGDPQSFWHVGPNKALYPDGLMGGAQDQGNLDRQSKGWALTRKKFLGRKKRVKA